MTVQVCVRPISSLLLLVVTPEMLLSELQNCTIPPSTESGRGK